MLDLILPISYLIHLSVNINQIFTTDTYINTTDPVVYLFPGRATLNSYEPYYITPLSTTWWPPGEIQLPPVFSNTFQAIRPGQTLITVVMQYSRYHPLFFNFNYQVSITQAENRTKFEGYIF